MSKIDNLSANVTLMSCPFCGGMPKFVVDDGYTKNNGTIVGCGLRFGCSNCRVYPQKPGHMYGLEVMLDPKRESGIRYMKDERMDLIYLWNNRVNKKTEELKNETK